jgi:hypothetical protein
LDQGLDDADQPDHAQHRERQLHADLADHPANVAGQDALGDAGKDEPDEEGGADGGGGPVGPVGGDEPVGLHVGVG